MDLQPTMNLNRAGLLNNGFLSLFEEHVDIHKVCMVSDCVQDEQWQMVPMDFFSSILGQGKA